MPLELVFGVLDLQLLNEDFAPSLCRDRLMFLVNDILTFLDHLPASLDNRLKRLGSPHLARSKVTPSLEMPQMS